MSPKGGPVVIIHTTYLAQVILSFTRMTQTRESNSQTTFWARFLFSRFFVTSLSENIVVFILQKEQKVCIFFSTLLNKANLDLKKTFFLTSHITSDVTIHWIHDRSRKCMEVRRNAFVSFHVVSSQILKKTVHTAHKY